MEDRIHNQMPRNNKSPKEAVTPSLRLSIFPVCFYYYTGL